MAQHHLWILLLCLQTWLEAASRDPDSLTVIGILGESVTFPLNIQESQQVGTIAWTSETSVAVVIPGDSGAAPKVTVTHKNYYERIHVLAQNYDLVINSLRMEDAGIYKADINIKNHPYTITKHYNLQVYRRLTKPKITQSLMTSVNSTCNVTLTCSVEKEEKNVTYSWSPLGKEGPVLQIVQAPEDHELTYTCTAWNPVSNSSDSISAQQLCADVTKGFRVHQTKFLSVLAGFFLVVLILSSVFWVHLYKRKQDAVSKKTIYTNITASRDTQPAEARIYDEIPPSKVLPSNEEPANTIYSIVQFSDKMGKTSTKTSKPLGTSSYEIVI
ncbi:SLAM family member 5 [Nycticebus coucang]|uniref:SLAM family member 5 n=1 Tax=Nycticebus coucang TaxID=9470 RepID=UPI00234DAAA6|nr:SLAM family member 5 [Nycticebus coucang]XP_053463790.1 SLAM family member 5 [Nycticebus coucang]